MFCCAALCRLYGMAVTCTVLTVIQLKIYSLCFSNLMFLVIFFYTWLHFLIISPTNFLRVFWSSKLLVDVVIFSEHPVYLPVIVTTKRFAWLFRPRSWYIIILSLHIYAAVPFHMQDLCGTALNSMVSVCRLNTLGSNSGCSSKVLVVFWCMVVFSVCVHVHIGNCKLERFVDGWLYVTRPAHCVSPQF